MSDEPERIATVTDSRTGEAYASVTDWLFFFTWWARDGDSGVTWREGSAWQRAYAAFKKVQGEK